MTKQVSWQSGNNTVLVPTWFPKAFEGFGGRIREARHAKGLSQPQLAKAIGTFEQRISRFENGHIVPKLVVVGALALALDTTVDYLVYGDRRP